MPPLKKERWERFAQLLAQAHPPSRIAAYQAVGFKPDPGHASRLADNPLVAARIAELQALAGKLAASAQAKAEARAVAKIEITRQSLIEESVAALKLAESAENPQGMVQAIRLLAELAHISLKAPEDKPQPQRHLHLHEGMIDRPPNETLDQWIERKRIEADNRTTKRLKVVSNDTSNER